VYAETIVDWSFLRTEYDRGVVVRMSTIVKEVKFDLDKGWDAKEPEDTSYQYYSFSNSYPGRLCTPGNSEGMTELEKILQEGARERYIKEFHLPPDWKFDLIGVEKD
jgi:hypothetical protein